MAFVNRETQFPERRKIIKVDGNNIPVAGESPILVKIIRDEGAVYEEGTPVNAENLNMGNWRDDRSVSFTAMENDTLPGAKAAKTQIVTKANGETWIIPPAGLGNAIRAADPIGTPVSINGHMQDAVDFVSDPQEQITYAIGRADVAIDKASIALGTANGRSAVFVGGVKKDGVEFRADPQTQIDTKSTVKVNNVRKDIEFDSDPQTQIDGKAQSADLGIVSRDLGDHLARTDNPHGVTKDQVGLGNVNNTSDADKPISAAQQIALNTKANDVRLTGVKRWELMYTAGNGQGVPAVGTTTIFGTNIPDDTVFRVHIRDNRGREFNGANTRFTQTGTIMFRNGEGAMWQYDSPFDQGIGFRIRTLFRRVGENGVYMFTQASRMSSDGNTNWYEETNYYIVRIEKEVGI